MWWRHSNCSHKQKTKSQPQCVSTSDQTPVESVKQCVKKRTWANPACETSLQCANFHREHIVSDQPRYTRGSTCQDPSSILAESSATAGRRRATHHPSGRTSSQLRRRPQPASEAVRASTPLLRRARTTVEGVQSSTARNENTALH